jgi:hypothetical protein
MSILNECWGVSKSCRSGAYSRSRRLGNQAEVPDAVVIRIDKHARAMGATSSTVTSKLHSHILFF